VPKVWLQVKGVDGALHARLKDAARRIVGSELRELRHSAVYYLVVILRRSSFSASCWRDVGVGAAVPLVDEKGARALHRYAAPPSAKSAQKKNLKANDLRRQPSYELTQAIRQRAVTLYTFPDCKDPCQMARDVLNKPRRCPFKEKLIQQPGCWMERKQVRPAGLNVPVLVVATRSRRPPRPGSQTRRSTSEVTRRRAQCVPAIRRSRLAPKPPPQSSAAETPPRAHSRSACARR